RNLSEARSGPLRIAKRPVVGYGRPPRGRRPTRCNRERAPAAAGRRTRMGRLDGKVAVISGAARGQGRAHAVTLAREGASIVAFDVCEPLSSVMTPGATEEDLAETMRLVEEQDQRCVTSKTDARDLAGLQALAARAMGEFGRVDILLVNHGLWHVSANSWDDLEEDAWQESIDVMLTGAWK